MTQEELEKTAGPTYWLVEVDNARARIEAAQIRLEYCQQMYAKTVPWSPTFTWVGADIGDIT